MKPGRIAPITSIFVTLIALVSSAHGADPPKPKPLFHEFMGLNGHTIQFKPALYAPAVRAVRDYHPLGWDLGDDTSFKTRFPMARNGVDWGKVYGSWKSAGYETDVCIMLHEVPAKAWRNMSADAFAYGRSFAQFFGPSSANRLVASVEVGNEPGHYDDDAYRALFQNMAKGLREGDPKLKIGTCALALGVSDKYSKSVKCVQGLEDLYDFLNIHTYAEVEGYPTWRRSYPEDPKIDYLIRVRALIDWRDHNAPDKEVRITEFGWDASTKNPPKTGDFAKWEGSTEEQQAQYLVRSFLVFSKMDITRAYIYFFDDRDEPQVHGSSGLTRNGQPKPAFHAVAHLQKTLGDYRFERILIEKPGDIFVYEYVRGSDSSDRVWVVWSPTGVGRHANVVLETEQLRLISTAQMPLTPGPAPAASFAVRGRALSIAYSESPVFIRFKQ